MADTRPARLGRYQIVEEIGKGAMGVVYLARDPLIGRLVALKTFRIADPSDQELAEARERFIREAQSAGILSHPNIVTIHDVVEASDEGATIIAMEYVRGTDLKEMLRRDEPLDLSEVSDLIWQVAEALEYAHSKGVVHRDIKPANILITGDGRVKLTDFGIARLNTSNLTHAGQLLGTPNYMAPEQIRGFDVDHRADIFSLGVVLYEMLCRQKPFRGENLTMVTHKIVHEPFTPLADHATELPAEMTQLLERALAKKPEQRYQRVGELARDLKQLAEKAAREEALNDTQAVPPLGDLDDTRPPSAPVVPAVVPAVPMAPPAQPVPLPPAAPNAPTVVLPRVVPEAAVSSGSLLPPIVESLPPPPLAAKSPQKGARPVGQGSLVRGLAVAATALVVSLGLGLGILATLQPGPPTVTELAADREVSGRYATLALLFSAREALEAGDLVGAVSTLRQAEQQDPGSTRIRESRQEAERKLAETEAATGREEQLRLYLEQGEEAYARRRFTAAAELARQALLLDPGSPVAMDLLARAEGVAAKTDRRNTLAAAPAAEPTGPAAEPAPIETTPEEPAETVAPNAPATLNLSFRSEVSQGTLTVYLGQRQLLREPFRFTEKRGLLRSKAVSGTLERSLTLPPGQHQLRVYVALDRTRTETVEGNFPPGMTRTLAVTVGAGGELSVSLR